MWDRGNYIAEPLPMQGIILSRKKKRFRTEAFAVFRRIQFPAVAPADGEAIGSVGMTGATVSIGAGLIVGCTVAAGVAAFVGAGVGALVGIDALPRIEQVHPASVSSSARSGIKKNRFIMRISFRFFFVSIPARRAAMRLRRPEKYAILRT